MRYGYKASAEQFGPRDLLDYSLLAERLGFDTVSVSDHFQPWRHTTGHAPNALVWLGALATSSGGHGLVGMRERVAMLGGELDAGYRRDGGFGVHARLPLTPSES